MKCVAGCGGTFLSAVLALVALSMGTPEAYAEEVVYTSPLADPDKFALAKEVLRPYVNPDAYDPAKKPYIPGVFWPDTYEEYLRAFIRVARADINDDGVGELFYYIEDTGYCGSAGCPMLIFEKRNGAWKFICATSGGRDITITDWVSEGGYRELQDRYVIYWRNGRCYDDAPRTPETEDLPPRGERTWKPIR